MAKGNLFMGMGKGKIGDIVLSRQNGVQISRARNRNPKNPRSNAQLYQRMIMATIMQAYSAGKEIFDHSFQGKSVGSENMREFMSRNLRSLRGALATEIKQSVPLAEKKVRVVSPASATPVPVNGLVAAQGSLTQMLFKLVPKTAEAVMSVTINGDAASTTTVEDWLQSLDLRRGDIYTIVAFVADPSETRFYLDGSEGEAGTQFDTKFGWCRLTVKDTFLTKEGTMSGLKIKDVFNIDTDGVVFTHGIGEVTIVNGKLTSQDLFGYEGALGTIGFIHSRDDQDLRSDCYMQEMDPTTIYGILAWYALEAWQKGDQGLGNSDLILEGGVTGGGAASNTQNQGGGGGSTGTDTPAKPPVGGGD